MSKKGREQLYTEKFTMTKELECIKTTWVEGRKKKCCRGLSETEKPLKKYRQKPENRKKFRPKLETEIKDLPEKALVGSIISLSFI